MSLLLEGYVFASVLFLSCTLLPVEDVLGFSLLSLELLLGFTLDLAHSSGGVTMAKVKNTMPVPEGSLLTFGVSSFSPELAHRFLGFLLLSFDFPVHAILGSPGLTLDSTDSLFMTSVGSIFGMAT